MTELPAGYKERMDDAIWIIGEQAEIAYDIGREFLVDEIAVKKGNLLITITVLE